MVKIGNGKTNNTLVATRNPSSQFNMSSGALDVISWVSAPRAEEKTNSEATR